MTDSGPGNKTPGVKFSVESDFQVKNARCLRLEGKNKEKRNSKNSKKKYLLFSFSCFFLIRSPGYYFLFRQLPGLGILIPGLFPPSLDSLTGKSFGTIRLKTFGQN